MQRKIDALAKYEKKGDDSTYRKANAAYLVLVKKIYAGLNAGANHQSLHVALSVSRTSPVQLISTPLSTSEKTLLNPTR